MPVVAERGGRRRRPPVLVHSQSGAPRLFQRRASFSLIDTMTPNQPFLASQRDVLLLLARILLVILFIMFGWKKIVDFPGTIAFMGSEGAPAPIISAAISVVMELFVGIAILVGFQTRALALLLALYTIGTGIIGHHYWTMTGGEQINNMIHFYKNIAIAGGLFALCAAGPGRFSIDRG
ncbi:DoxX family protein [Burkholderia sp. Ac-20392]|nr:DoxX family protein [Burkholderia sp. Se-20378]MBN3794917.1 DoxX family protein [Burkholderia sp. Ac-20392]